MRFGRRVSRGRRHILGTGFSEGFNDFHDALKGEVAVKVGMDEQTGKMRIEAWCESRNGKFNSSELQEIYLNASTECEELNDDPAAVNLLEAFGSHENGLSYQVFSWERGLPEGIEPIEPGEPDIFEP